MSAALIHDKCAIKNFWERKIENHCEVTEHEKSRMKKSSLIKLRGEWVKKLESRTKHLKKLQEENMRKAGPHTEEQA